jgi:Ca2+-binding RTX toxin-like protein
MRCPSPFSSHPLQGGLLAGLVAFVVVLASLITGAEAGTEGCAGGPTTSGETTRGTPCPDLIVAEPGVEAIYGGGGADTIYATPGVAVYGGGGDDRIYAAPDGVSVDGGEGADLISAVIPRSARPARAAARARVALSASCPTGCYLTPGDDQFDGGPGPDIVYGGRSNDILNGGGGDDLLYGGLGDDTVRGNEGNDLLSGGWGADSLDGEAGDDYVRGDGTPDPTIQDTGGGNDTLSYATGIAPGFSDSAGYPNFSSYRSFPAAGGERGVYLNLGTSLGDNGVPRYGGGVDTIPGDGFETVIGTAFSDYIVSSDRSQTIYGGGGGDVLLGMGGNDKLYGGADGDHLDGGSGANTLNGNAGSDYCRSPEKAAGCERRKSDTGVVLRNSSKISLGMMAPEAAGRTQIYMTGSSLADSVSATYNPGSPARVTFAVAPGSAGFFNRDSSASSGCSIPTATEAVCTLSKPLDSILLAGFGAADILQASGFPTTTSVMNLGGEGSDTLSGGDLSEDVLVDGPDFTGFWDDRLYGFGGDDALVNNGGADDLFAGSGNDLMLSIFACGGDELNGGPDRDNASWARATTGVEAHIVEGVAGRPGTAAGPECGTGPLSALAEVEDLEGTSFADRLFGGPGPNQLLGRAGGDSFYGAEGADLLLTNAGDADPVISCGADTDTAVIDHPLYGESPDPDCESLPEADPKYAG